MRSNRSHQKIVIKIVKRSFDVKLNNPVKLPTPLTRDGYRLLRRPAGTIPV
jgi:hypothetical protein